jgi:hypothetical protein
MTRLFHDLHRAEREPVLECRHEELYLGGISPDEVRQGLQLRSAATSSTTPRLNQNGRMPIGNRLSLERSFRGA